MDNRRKILVLLIAIIGLISVTIGITYAFISYTKEGEYENSIKSGSITFHYNEDTRGISLEDALPISDNQGKSQNKYFDFTITSKTTTDIAIPYLITARKSGDLDSSIVKVALFKVTNDENDPQQEIEEELYTSFYDKLDNTTQNNIVEKVLYKESVPVNTNNYNEKYRLRIWIDENTDFSPEIDPETGEYIEVEGEYVYPYNGKTFSIQVNVYAEGKLTTSPAFANGISNITVDNETLTGTPGEVYDYEVDVNHREAEVVVETENEYVRVDVVRMDSTFTNEIALNDNIKRLSTKKTINLNPGDNYLKVTVTPIYKPEDKVEVKIKAHVDTLITGDSILQILKENNLVEGTYKFSVNNIVYPVHLYVYNTSQTWNDERTFGDSADIGTETTNAKNMVVVKVNGDLTIGSSGKVEPYYTEYGGPKGFTLYVTGTLTNNGTIDNSHGAKAVGEDVYLYKNNNNTYEYVPAVGGSGATGTLGGNVNGTAGSDVVQTGTRRATAGGSSGVGYTYGSIQCYGGSGGTGTSYSSGTGGGGSGYTCTNTTAGSPNGGQGGTGHGRNDGTSHSPAGGGAGNPGGDSIGGGGVSGSNGTGGLLVIYANILENNNKITANGSSGGSTNQSGGSSGGGSINIFCSTSYNDNGLMEAKGVAEGTINIGIIHNGRYSLLEDVILYEASEIEYYNSSSSRCTNNQTFECAIEDLNSLLD